jgi:hypothetical protein
MTDFNEAWRSAARAGTQTRQHDPETPAGAEAKLAAFGEELDKARQLLTVARDAEMTAKELRDEAWRKAMLSDECPKVGVFAGVRTTVAMQEAWVASQIAEQDWLLHRATLARKEAADKFRTIAAQASYWQTLTKSVANSYWGTGERT